MNMQYDIIVVGAGHAGCEAAAAAANIGAKVLLITMDMTKFAQMSCNPAMGGIAKGQIVREIDALGGYSGIVTDRSTIQFRMLNRSKGPAMWSPRAQCDRSVFTLEWRKILENIENIDFWQDSVTSLIIENSSVIGVNTAAKISFFANNVILTNGTFLNGLMHIGRSQMVGGRVSEPSSTGITEQLFSFGFETGRMKTGTPARLDGRSIDFSELQRQDGEDTGNKFSFLSDIVTTPNLRACYITYTNQNVHSILKRGFEDSPLYNGSIKGVGPRYCPSIEDKVVRFAEKDSHQLFLEPEGVSTNEYYLNGFSSSLPWQIQYEALLQIKGLEKVKIFRPGYAIEYDFFQPTQLKPTLETKYINGLFFAGQINGTTGYEEAAAQGLMAGINAAMRVLGKESLVLGRDQAYIGVLIDDLVTKGVDEPYRMFTSRAEYRILLRQDDADFRLSPIGYKIGLATKERYLIVLDKLKKRDSVIAASKKILIKPEQVNSNLRMKNSSELKQPSKIHDLLLRPELSIQDILSFSEEFHAFVNDVNGSSIDVLDSVEIAIKYSGYIDREKQIAEKIIRLEGIKISQEFDYSKFTSLSTEARQKLGKIRPETIGQASRISGISPSDINVLLVHLGR
jgi:tRNA uridine 5-carboxymethylaminomethyl modification enzyme